MSIRDLIDAIDSGDSVAIQQCFEQGMMGRVADRLDAMRVTVAQSMFKESVQQVDESEEILGEGILGTHFQKPGDGHENHYNKIRQVHKKLTAAGYTADDEQHKRGLAGKNISHRGVNYTKPGTSPVRVDYGHASPGETFVRVQKTRSTKANLPEEFDQPTGIKIYHKDKEGKEGHAIVFSSRDAQDREKDVKKAGGKVTHRALMFGTREGDKHPVNEELELDQEGQSMDEAARGPVRGSSVLFKAGQKALKNMKKSEQDRKENDQADSSKKAQNEDFALEDFSAEEIEAFMQTEEFEQLDELSKTTLKQYSARAKDDVADMKSMKRDAARDVKRNPEMADYHKDTMSRADQYISRRQKGLGMAAKRLAKEEAGDIDEIQESAKEHYMSGFKAQSQGKTRQHNPYKEGSLAAKYWANGFSDSFDKKTPAKFSEEVELDGVVSGDIHSL
jgi:hypothetical protein